MAAFGLTPEGYFAQNGKRLIPVGVNYWPASCGVEMWQAWPAEEIQADLDLVQSLGLNCVRFFLRWQDFEPRPGRYDKIAFARLARLLDWCRQRNLLAHPSLFVGWMSGGIFWPAWKKEKNLFSNPFLRRRAFAFAAKAAAVCSRTPASILAIDQGNELCCLPECLEARPAEVASWCAGVNAAVRRAFPAVLLISGNEQMQVTADTGWRLGAQPGCDLYSMHTYPNGAWHPLAFDGMTDPLAQSLLPFYLKCARAFGPVMMQEFGTLFTIGKSPDRYLKAMLPAAWEAGANGFLWWCLRDIAATCHPYEKNAFEGGMGLVDARGKIKPALAYFLEFAASLGSRDARAPRGARRNLVLYWPKHYYARGNPHNPGNDPRTLSRRLIIAHYALTALGHRVTVVRGDRSLGEIPPDTTLVVAGALLTASEVSALTVWVETGGRLIWHGLDGTTFGAATAALVGAEAEDFFAPRADRVQAFGAKWDFAAFARDIFVGVIPRSGRVVARDRRGRPVILTHRCGKGRVAACLAQVDDTFAAESDDMGRAKDSGSSRRAGTAGPHARSHWLRWYRGMLALTR